MTKIVYIEIHRYYRVFQFGLQSANQVMTAVITVLILLMLLLCLF